MDGYIVSYPRSGYHWLWERLYFAFESMGYQGAWITMKQTLDGIFGESPFCSNRVKHTHMGYGCDTWTCCPPGELTPKLSPALQRFGSNEHLFCLLRRPSSVLESLFSLLSKEPVTDASQQEAHDSYEAFVKSPWGLTRMIQYFNELDSILKSGMSYDLLFYEDNFSPESMNIVPKILGKDISREVLDNIFTLSSASNLLKRTADRGFDPQDLQGDTLHEMWFRHGSANPEQSSTLESYIADRVTKECVMQAFVECYGAVAEEYKPVETSDCLEVSISDPSVLLNIIGCTRYGQNQKLPGGEVGYAYSQAWASAGKKFKQNMIFSAFDKFADEYREVISPYELVTTETVSGAPGASDSRATQAGLEYAIERNYKYWFRIDHDAFIDPVTVDKIVGFMEDNDIDYITAGNEKPWVRIDTSNGYVWAIQRQAYGDYYNNVLRNFDWNPWGIPATSVGLSVWRVEIVKNVIQEIKNRYGNIRYPLLENSIHWEAACELLGKPNNGLSGPFTVDGPFNADFMTCLALQKPKFAQLVNCDNRSFNYKGNKLLITGDKTVSFPTWDEVVDELDTSSIHFDTLQAPFFHFGDSDTPVRIILLDDKYVNHPSFIPMFRKDLSAKKPKGIAVHTVAFSVLLARFNPGLYNTLLSQIEKEVGTDNWFFDNLDKSQAFFGQPLSVFLE